MHASDASFLETCGLMHASGVVITIQTRSVIDKVVNHVLALKPEMLIVSRARDADHACHLYAIGASDAVPETVEASLQLSEAALVGLGIGTGAASASTHEKRDEFRRALQEAARQAGRSAARKRKHTRVPGQMIPNRGSRSPKLRHSSRVRYPSGDCPSRGYSGSILHLQR